MAMPRFGVVKLGEPAKVVVCTVLLPVKVATATPPTVTFAVPVESDPDKLWTGNSATSRCEPPFFS